MKTKILAAFIVVTISSFVSGCAHKTIPAPQGVFKGQFIRSSPLARYAASQVTITFTGNSFSGESDQPNYPAICRGTFQINGKEIEFKNECMFTADFDWSFILKDKFEFSLTEGQLEMIKSKGDTVDRYSLRLQE